MPSGGLEELPRPVVTFLMNNCKQEPRDALIECLRELAKDGVIRYGALVTDDRDDYQSWAQQQREELGQAARAERSGYDRLTRAGAARGCGRQLAEYEEVDHRLTADRVVAA